MKIVALGPDHWGWVKSHLHCHWSEDTRGLVATKDDGTPMGAVVLYGWTESAVSAHFVVTNPLALRRGGLFDETYRFVFHTCDLEMMLGATPGDKPKALKLVKHLGWQQLYVLEDGYAVGVPLVYTRYLKTQWQAANQEKAA